MNYVKNYYSLKMNKASFEEMINPNSEIGKAIANGTLQNEIIKLTGLVQQMRTATGIFLVFVCFRIVQLLSNFSRRLDTFSKTILMSVQSLTFYICILVIVLLGYSSCC